MTSELGVEAVLDGWAGSRDFTVGGVTMDTPDGVKSHRVTSLQAKSILAAQESRTARRPGK